MSTPLPAEAAGDTAARLAEDERLARLTGEARDRTWPNVRPADAATLIILDRSGAAPRVLMGRRNPALAFMPRRFVFPGGRTDPADARVAVASELGGAVETALLARTTRGTPARARRLALAAIRETFEETGLVIGRPGAAPKAGSPGSAWGDFLATNHLPDLAGLTYLARAITPPKRPKRFDTRFFVVDAGAIAHRVETVVGPEAELTELAWLTLAETVALPLPAITRAVLADLDAAIGAGGPTAGAPIPFYFERHRVFQREMIS